MSEVWTKVRSEIKKTRWLQAIGFGVIFTPICLLIYFAWHQGLEVVIFREGIYRARTSEEQEANKRKFDASLRMFKEFTGGIGVLATIGGGIVLYLNFRVANKNAEIANKNGLFLGKSNT